MEMNNAALVGTKIWIGRGMLRQEVTVLSADSKLVRLQHAGGRISHMPADILADMRKP